jgi:hypothetical protein
VNPGSTVPGIVQWAVRNVTYTSFEVGLIRTNTTATTLQYLAIQMPS